MRPELLFSYFSDIERLSGVGKRTGALMSRVAGNRIRDVLFHLPISLVDRSYCPSVINADAGTVCTLDIEVVEHKPSSNKRAPYKVLCRDDTAFLTLTFFNPRKDWLISQLPVGQRRLISGKVEHYNDQIQITHPDYMVDPTKADDLPAIETVYPLTAGLSGKMLRKAVQGALESVKDLPEWSDPALVVREKWPSFLNALRQIHNPDSPDGLASDHPARARIAFDELLSAQLALALVRDSTVKKRGRIINGTRNISDKIISLLPYALTNDQQAVLGDIRRDMVKETAMLRLVQGDVGSGKTIVALLAMATAAEAGVQSALLAPTEILARQHLASIKEIVDQVGLNVEILTGRNKGKIRREILERLASGDIDILIGTHAIIQNDVVFKDLGFAVIDEQHRFGVEQRLALSRKANVGVDMLGMTATPIPRTLTLTLYGDMDVSKIQEKPPGRKPIDTRVLSNNRLADVIAGLQRAIASGQRAYWVCPMVEESEIIDMAAAEERAKSLAQVFGDQVGLVHGRMKPAEKDDVMQRFQSGDIAILVATTVIEVGVNVPEATIMVIEHAERFGLSQLHQLRGRVGRGADKSSCLLLRADHINKIAWARLKILRETEDGFRIAEEDLRLRGSGEILGTRQSGMPAFKLVDFAAHGYLVDIARDDARRLVQANQKGESGLSGTRGEALRHLLYLFERDEGVRLLSGG